MTLVTPPPLVVVPLLLSAFDIMDSRRKFSEGVIESSMIDLPLLVDTYYSLVCYLFITSSPYWVLSSSSSIVVLFDLSALNKFNKLQYLQFRCQLRKQ